MSDVPTLLKHPHPYRASLTVCSDTHFTPIETFEAVHTLINTTEFIPRGSDAWGRLFLDSEMAGREEWRDGIRGFGLPIADTLWLYSPGIGVFERYDEAAGRPVPQVVRERDMREVVDTWLRRGWVDALHTPGPGRITREATAAGLRWLEERTRGRLRVWVNHSIEKTPSCIEPDRQHALRAVLRNLARGASGLLYGMGLRKIARRVSWPPEIRPFPPGSAGLLWSLAGLLVASGAALGAGLAVPHLRTTPYLASTAGFLAALVAILQAMPVRYALGDNPGTPFYCADLAREFGFRFFWFVKSQPGYESHVEGKLALPEEPCGGRPSCLRVARLDDGSRVLVFGRGQKESPNAWGSLHLLTEEGLGDLVARQGTGILYTHWASLPCYCFTARSLDGLARLQRFFETERVWVAPTSEILRFAAVRAFLDYEVHSAEGRRVIDIVRVKDPARGHVVPSLEELRGIAFALPDDAPTEIRLEGQSLPAGSWARLSHGPTPVVGFPLDRPGAPSPRTPDGVMP
jgi:hypothetical protein